MSFKNDMHAQYVQKMGEPLGTFTFYLTDDVGWLTLKWREFNHLFASGNIDLLNRVASNYFYYMLRLQFGDAVLHIAKLTDPPENRHQRNLSIQGLPPLVSDAGLRGVVLPKITEADICSTFARGYRNKWIAHSDFDHRSGAITALPSVEQKQVSDALVAIQDVVRCVENHYGIPPIARLDDRWGATKLIGYLRKCDSAKTALRGDN